MLLEGAIAENVLASGSTSPLSGFGEKLGLSSINSNQNQKKKNNNDPMEALQKSELVKSAIFGNSIQNNMNNLNNVMANAQNRQPMQYSAPSSIQFNAPQLMQRQFMPSAFTNNNGRYL